MVGQVLKFVAKYRSFTEAMYEVIRLQAFYKEHQLDMTYDIYPYTLEVSYEVTQKGRSTERVNS